MKSDFLLAITQLSAEKNLPKEVVLSAVESALASAYRKDNFASNQNITVKINPNSGKVEVWAEKVVVEKPEDPRREIPLEAARQLKNDIQLGETIMVEVTPRNAGRIAAQTAKQVILQRLHEAEHSAILEEFTDKEGSIVTGTIQRIEPSKQIFIDLGRTEAILPVAEQMRTERYRVGQRLKVYLLEVARTSKGPRMVVSRSHPNLLRRLFELEIPEVLNGTVEIKSIAREAGYRSKVAVAARQEGIDAVGSCVGLRGIRIQNIVNELAGEKIDVVQWAASPASFIANALSPAQVVGVSLNEAEKTAQVVIPDRQLSLAIGKEGQNVRLAAKLTDWRIDIKSVSAAEVEKQALQAAQVKETVAPEAPEVVVRKPAEVEAKATTTKREAPEPAKEEAVAEVAKIPAPETVPAPELIPVGAVSEKTETAESKEEEETIKGTPVSLTEEVPRDTAKGQIRFAEDILGFRPTKPTGRPKKMKKKGA
ncbi:MAG: transcription termination factor NusA, partial [Chloroflexota bacterium]